MNTINYFLKNCWKNDKIFAQFSKEYDFDLRLTLSKMANIIFDIAVNADGDLFDTQYIDDEDDETPFYLPANNTFTELIYDFQFIVSYKTNRIKSAEHYLKNYCGFFPMYKCSFIMFHFKESDIEVWLKNRITSKSIEKCFLSGLRFKLEYENKVISRLAEFDITK